MADDLKERVAAFKRLEFVDDLCVEIRRLREILGAVLARDAEFGLSDSPLDCGCMRLSRDAEREYEAGTCPHQRARAALAQENTK